MKFECMCDISGNMDVQHGTVQAVLPPGLHIPDVGYTCIYCILMCVISGNMDVQHGTVQAVLPPGLHLSGVGHHTRLVHCGYVCTLCAGRDDSRYLPCKGS